MFCLPLSHYIPMMHMQLYVMMWLALQAVER